RIHSPSRRTRAPGSPPTGRACVSPPQCVWWPNGACVAASRARSSHSRSSSPSSGGRIIAAIANPPGRRDWNRANAAQTASSSGRSTWQETNAYRVSPMCGICGQVSRAGAADPDAVGRMNDALVHRGPDEGSVDVFGECVLGDRRLRVLDLETGSQPAANESGDVVCVFNGELYEFRALRSELASRGHTIPGSGDTAVIPHLYEDHGVAFVERLHGMFAVALWDAPRRRLVLARDRAGKKPLLWTEPAPGRLAFASELKALLRLPSLRREVDLAALDAYLALQYVPSGTPLRGINKLPPGHRLVWENGEATVERWWRLAPEPAQLTEDEWLERVRETVRAAVRRRPVSDGPLGAPLP